MVVGGDRHRHLAAGLRQPGSPDRRFQAVTLAIGLDAIANRCANNRTRCGHEASVRMNRSRAQIPMTPAWPGSPGPIPGRRIAAAGEAATGGRVPRRASGEQPAAADARTRCRGGSRDAVRSKRSRLPPAGPGGRRRGTSAVRKDSLTRAAKCVALVVPGPALMAKLR